jgi:hypothetical protein
MNSPKLIRFVRHALIAATGVAAPSVPQLASAFDVLCDRLRTRLHPMFGPHAVAALFARAHHLSISEFTWLVDVVPTDGERCSLDGLQSASHQVDPDTIAIGLAAILAHAIGLLCTFIGDDLVMPVVQEAWCTASLGERHVRTEGTR